MFNATVTLIGSVILLVHIANVAIKKNRRKDENALLAFLVFTALHFAVYFVFTLIRVHYTSDAFIMGFYTGFYIANNIEALLFFIYMLAYIEISAKTRKTLQILNISLFSLFVLLDIVNLFAHFLFSASNGEYVRSPTMVVSQGYQFVLFATVFVIVVSKKNLKLRERLAFSFYCVVPLIAIILQNVFKGYAIAYLSIIVAIEVLFFFLNVERNLELVREEEKRKDAQIRMMLSQIQPHFIYNALSSISTLISIDPEKAQKALDDFTEYLRANLSSLTENRLISFEDELRHIEAYLALEKMRFGDRVKIIYDIQCKDFYLPPLSVQPLVENAVKHGIFKKVEGGTLTLRSYENEKTYVVEVLDDGVGFDMNDVDFTANEHIGLNNIGYRISRMCRGTLDVQSKPGEGTKVAVIIQK